MGWCHEFGVQIRPGCGHPMLAGQSACYCEECQTVCEGHFGGCPDVWARGPGQPVPMAGAQAQGAAPPQATPTAAGRAQPGPAMQQFAAAQAGRNEMIDWLRNAFEGLRAEIRGVNEGLARQQSILAQLAEAREAEVRVVALADTLPDRLGTAIAAAIEARQGAYVGRVDEIVNSLGTHVARTLPDRLGTAIADAVEVHQETVLASVNSAIQQLRADLGAELANSLSKTLPKRVGTATAEAVEARHAALMEQIGELSASLGSRLADSMVQALGPALESATGEQQAVVAAQVHEATAELRDSLAEMQASAAGFRAQTRVLQSTGTAPQSAAAQVAAPQIAPPRSVEDAAHRAVDQVLDRAGGTDNTTRRRTSTRSNSAPRSQKSAPTVTKVSDGELRAAKTALREQVWAAMAAAKANRFPGTEGRIPNFVGAEAAADLLRTIDEWPEALALKSNPDAPQWPVRERALTDGKLLYMAVPRLADEQPFFLLDPADLNDTPRRASSIKGAAKAARHVGIDELEPLDLVVTGCVAVGEDGARLGKGGGFSDLEFAIATEAGVIGPDTVVVTTVHELQVRPPGMVPMAEHDLWVDIVVTPERVIRCGYPQRRRAGRVAWDLLDENKIASIPVLQRLRPR